MRLCHAYVCVPYMCVVKPNILYLHIVYNFINDVLYKKYCVNVLMCC